MLVNGIHFVNLTPHTLTIVVSDEITLTIPASGESARVSQDTEVLAPVAGIPVFRSTLGEVVGLPAPAENTIYIVSTLAASAIQGRDDVLAPGDLIRNELGQPVGCKGLKRV